MLWASSFLFADVYAAAEDFEPDFGDAPEIDGDIERSKKEWENASKEEILLTSPETTTGLTIDIWVMQNASDLYISIQFELLQEYRSPNEFVAIIISKSDSDTNTSFYDAKIVQFYDLGGPNEDYRYRDYHIDNGLFIRDDEDNGEGAADLHGEKIIYEFRIPVNDSEGEDSEDVTLEFGDPYAFKIVYGENDNYNAILNEKSNIIEIEIQYPEEIEEPWWKIFLFIMAIIVFSLIGGLYGLYIYKILVLKKKIGRIRE
jgi:hypothetical protein